MLKFPLIIANGTSQLSHKWYSDALNVSEDDIKLCSDQVAEELGGFCASRTLIGSSNRRIIRSTLYACIEQKKLNPEQKTIVILELALDLRKEIWLDRETTLDASEGNFKSVQLARDTAWWSLSRNRARINNNDLIPGIMGEKLDSTEQRYLNKWQQGEMFFYSPYAETINTLADLIMLTSFLKLNNIDYLIYRANPVEQFTTSHLLDSFRNQIDNDPGIIDIFNFSFTGWCIEQKYRPVDFIDRPELGHPSLEAHQAFGKLLTQKLKEAYPQWA